MRSSLLQTGLWTASLATLLGAGAVYKHRRDGQMHALEAQQAHQTRAVELLARAMSSEAEMAYSATCRTSAVYDGREMKSQARVLQVPGALEIKYFGGAKRGLDAGYTGRWIWRQGASQPPLAYADLDEPPLEKARRSFEKIRKNYRAEWLGRDTIDGRQVEVVELRPLHPVKGATGPARRLWIDSENGIAMRVMSFNWQMRPMMQSTMNDISLSKAVTVSMKPAQIMAVSKAQDKALKMPWMAEEMGRDAERVRLATGVRPPQPSVLPPGYVLECVGAHRCEVNGKAYRAAVARYSDGLNNLTLFAMPRDATSDFKADQKRWCSYGTGALAMRDSAQGRVIAVSDLPPAYLSRVAASAQIEAN